MRITTNSQTTTFQSNLFQIQERLDKQNQRIATGKDIVRLADAPGKISDIQQLSTLIDRNSLYQKSMQEVSGELTVVGASLQTFADKLSAVREVGLVASETSNHDKLPVLAQQIFQQLTDMVKIANSDFDGKYSFAGTKTTPDSIVPTPPQVTNEPFELIQNPPTAANPSGYQVVFKGNLQDRVINKSANSTEVINTKADIAFGAGGTEVFDTMINAYNLLNYRADGTQRDSSELFTTGEQRTLQSYVTDMTKQMSNLDQEIGRVGYRQSRMETLSQQIDEDNTRLAELRSQQEDTNMPEALLQLKKEENALQYTLQVGSRMINQSLLDFLR
jgi:flagellar hook-associated protein 3 FlgL